MLVNAFLMITMISICYFKQETAYEVKECDWSSDVCAAYPPPRTTH